MEVQTLAQLIDGVGAVCQAYLEGKPLPGKPLRVGLRQAGEAQGAELPQHLLELFRLGVPAQGTVLFVLHQNLHPHLGRLDTFRWGAAPKKQGQSG